MPYSHAHFRTVRHGTESVDVHCRHCHWSDSEGDEGKLTAKARYHARKYLHTVDVYRSNWTEFTSYAKPQESLIVPEVNDEQTT